MLGRTADAGQEIVRMLCDQPVRGKRARREVPEVGGKDDVRFAANRCSDDMAIVGVGQSDGRHEFLEAKDLGIAEVRIHELAGSREARCRDVRPASPQRTDPLVMDGFGPLCMEDVRYRELEQQVA